MLREEEGLSVVEAMQKMKNPNSLEIRTECYVESFLADTKPMDHYQFQRIGYFCTDKDSTADHLIFNRTVSLKDNWSKIKGKA